MYSYIGILALCLATVTGFDRSIGATPPLGYFDPFGFSNDKSMSELVKLRESELKHCRWGMVAAVAIPSFEVVTHKAAIHALNDPVTFASFVSAVAVAESRSLSLGWKNPFLNSSNLFIMKEDYQPGDLDFKTILNKKNPFLANAELNNGRLGMIAALGMITQELIFDTIFIRVVK
jgi:hypothetical protein